MDCQALQSEWRSKLPFLHWTAGGPLLGLDRNTGAEGYRCKDGSIVAYEDPRVAEYSRAMTAAFMREARENVQSCFEHVVTADDPFPMEFVVKRPEFIRWLNGNGSLAALTIFEARVLWPAYEKRLLMLKEKAVVDEPDFLPTRRMSLAEGSIKLGCPVNHSNKSQWVWREVDAKRIRRPIGGGRSYQFDIRDFPRERQDEVRQVRSDG